MPQAVLFPGQGAQFPGMGKEWVEAFPTARRMFERAEEVLEFGLREACWDHGEEVHRTDVAQPGILTTSVAIIEVLKEQGMLDPAKTALTAGLSLGEYTALWYAGALSFEDAVKLVRLRGQAMQDASERRKSSMTSLMGATPEQAKALAEVGRAHGICSVANLNAPGQIVLSGELAALAAAEAAAPQHGVKRAVRLSVAGGFHSECMRPAAESLKQALEGVDVLEPRIPFVSNVTGTPLSAPDEIKENLARQVCSSVLWESSMRYALAAGIDSVLEPGPGNVLCGLMRRIAKDAGQSPVLRGVEKPDDLTGEA